MRFTLTLALLVTAAHSTFANLYITEPTAKTSASAADNFDITWIPQNDTTPLPSAYGPTTVSLMTGSTTTQFVLQTFGTLQDPSITVKVVAKIDPTVGENSADYFIRFQSVSGVDANNVPLQAFSARFKLKGMTGTFTSAMNTANVAATDAASTVASTGLASVVSNTTRTPLLKGSASATGSTKGNVIQTASSGSGTLTSTRTASSASATSSTSAAGKFEVASTGLWIALVGGVAVLAL